MGWFPSQLKSEQPASRRTTIFYIVRQNGRGTSPPIDPSVRGRGGHTSFYKFPKRRNGRAKRPKFQPSVGEGGGDTRDQGNPIYFSPPNYASNATKQHHF